jgi:signal peptidase I
MSGTPENDADHDLVASPPATLRHRHRTPWYIEWVLVIVAVVMIAMLFRTYVAQTFYVPSRSMEPTLDVGDRIIASKLSVTWGTIHRGDIVVFHAPSSVAAACGSAPEPFLVKRVIGVPGDHLRSLGNTIYVKETWSHTEPLGRIISPVTVGPHSYYMVGDNHFYSCDSRYWGTVQRTQIIGKVFIRIWPLSRWGFL